MRATNEMKLCGMRSASERPASRIAIWDICGSPMSLRRSDHLACAQSTMSGERTEMPVFHRSDSAPLLRLHADALRSHRPDTQTIFLSAQRLSRGLRHPRTVERSDVDLKHRSPGFPRSSSSAPDSAACRSRRSLPNGPFAVTVIDRRNYHLFQPLLYQVATAALSPADVAAPIRGILRDAENCEVMLAKVTGVDPVAQIGHDRPRRRSATTTWSSRPARGTLISATTNGKTRRPA